MSTKDTVLKKAFKKHCVDVTVLINSLEAILELAAKTVHHHFSPKTVARRQRNKR